MSLNIVKGNIWSLAAQSGVEHKVRPYVCIPTSLCWKADGHAVMGRGLALQAAKREPGLTKAYGTALINGCCRDDAGKLTRTFVAKDDIYCWRWIGEQNNLLMLPTKPLNPDQPQLSWQNPADITTIERSIRALHTMLVGLKEDNRQVLLPLLGCGNGQMNPQIVWMIFHRMFPTFRADIADRITIIEPHGNAYNAS